MKIQHYSYCLVVLAFCVAAARANEAADELHRLFEDRHAWEMREFPETAMSQGDYTNADKITDVSLAAVLRRHAETLKHLQRLLAVEKRSLGDEDRLSYDMFRWLLKNRIDAHRFRMFLAPVGQRSGPHQSIPQMGDRVRFNSHDDYENYLTRLELTPKLISDTIELLRMGLKEGRTPPKVTLEGVSGQFEALFSGGLSALRQPFDRIPASIDSEARTQLRVRFDQVTLPAVRKALERLSQFVVNDYIPNCRSSIAAVDLPNGDEFYKYRLRVSTTTEMSAQEIHELGLREVSRIRAEMLEVIRSSEFMEEFPNVEKFNGKELFTAFVRFLRTDPRFYHRTSQALLRDYRDICKRVDAWLPKLFKTLPRLPYGVREVPGFMAANQTTAYYQHGDIRNAEPGWFYANTYALDQRPKYEMTALAIHEAVPGHHLQVALAQEREDIPEFRKNMWVTAYGEGWALYSERLGLEMGMYDDPYDNFGRLLYEMWRACRLVVDPGMHALGWSRGRAVDFMLDNTALSELNVNNEIDRYIGWPGQATGYKIGELKIRELRSFSEKKLGKRFDIREFHDVVLESGCVPLPILEKRVKAWTESVEEPQ